MKKNPYFLNTMLAGILGLVMLKCVLLRAFAPAVILPRLNIPAMVMLSLTALVLEHYLAPVAKQNYPAAAALAVLTFGLLPYAADFAGIVEALKLAVVGGIVFTLTAWLFSEIQERLSSGPAVKGAPLFSALGLFLAAQCFSGII